MNFVVIGTDHRTQHSELEALLRAWCSRDFFEPLSAIAEEYHADIGESCARRIAKELDLQWFNLDMTIEEKEGAGILEEQRNRPKVSQGIAYRVPSDDIREDAWVEKLIKNGSGTTLVICGYLHFEPLVQRLLTRGHVVDKRVYLETVPIIKPRQESSP